MGRRIFITGAAGFIGFHVARALQKHGDHVLGYDNFNDYYCPRLKRARAAALQQEGVEVVEGDLCDKQKMMDLCKELNTTHFIHLAAQAGVRYSLVNPQAYIKTNIEGFVNVLEVCRDLPEVRLIYASSSSVYGNNQQTPFSIEDRTDNQASLYGVTKKSNELLAQTYHHLYGLPVVGLRFFTVYGPWGRPDMAYYSFAEKILREEPISLFNQGKMRRDFTYIDDLVTGVVATLEQEASCALFNLGNHSPVELGSFVEVLERALGKKAIKKYVGMQQGDVKETFADIEQSQQVLGFYPKTSLEEGLGQFVSWYRTYHKEI